MKLRPLFRTKSNLFLLLILFISCSSGNESVHVPDTILPKEKMAEVLTDVHILEASMSLNISNVTQIGNDNREETTLAIFKKNKVTKEQYDESFRFYGEHPDLLGEIYKLVLNKLSELQAKTANEKDSVRINDSTKKDSIKMDQRKLLELNRLERRKKIKPTP